MSGVDLDDIIGHPEPTAHDLTHPCPPPTGAEQADRMLYSLRRLRDRIAENERLAAAQIDLVTLWRDEENRKLQARYDWLQQGVQGWAAATHKADPDTKTIRLPNGAVEIRPLPPRVAVRSSADQLEELAKEHPGWVRRKLEPDKVALREAVVAGREAEEVAWKEEGYVYHTALDKTTGEVVEGVYLLVPKAKQITVKPT